MTPVDEETARTIMKLLGLLEDDDDVQSVAANLEVSDEVLRRLTAA
jgi:transcriptional/translational regulatory protein YebC/TACO1